MCQVHFFERPTLLCAANGKRFSLLALLYTSDARKIFPPDIQLPTHLSHRDMGGSCAFIGDNWAGGGESGGLE